MQRLRFALIHGLMLVLTLGCASASAAEIPDADPVTAGFVAERLDEVKRLGERWVSEGKIAGIVTLVNRGGKIVYRHTAGQRAVDDATPLREDDLFRIYSMTKPLTALAAMQLYEQGHFRLDDPVSKWIPELAEPQVIHADGSLHPASRPITVRHLLNHTAGLSYGFNPDDLIDRAYRQADLWNAADLDELARRLASIPLKFEPGEYWHYSIAVDLTGLLVQRVSGMPFNQYMQTHIFDPLDMRETFFELPGNKSSRLVGMHSRNAETGTLTRIESLNGLLGTSAAGGALSRYDQVTLFSGGGGLISSARDYMRFAEALRAGGTLDGHRIIGAQTLQYMRINHLGGSILSRLPPGGKSTITLPGYGFGLGFAVLLDPAASQGLSSEGVFTWSGAAGTVFWVDPTQDVTVVSMIQTFGLSEDLRHRMQIAVNQALAK